MPTTLPSWIDQLSDRIAGTDFDPRLIENATIDLGPQGERARAVADRLNAVRDGAPKRPVLLWSARFTAVTRRGPWVYVSAGFAQQLSDDALAFVLGHEMAHHDLGHLSVMYAAAGMLGNWQRIEFAADRHGLALAVRAGYARRAALEALDPSWDDDVPEDPLRGWHPALVRYLDRFRVRHPPMSARRRALSVEG